MTTKPKLLLIDDDKGVLNSNSLFLSKHFDVDTSETVEDAISKLASNKYKVAVIDMRLSSDDLEGGLRICRHINATGLDTKAIVLTAYGTVDNARKAYKEHVYDYIEKGTSYSSSALLSAALEAVEVPQEIVLKLSRENLRFFSELQKDLDKDKIGIIKEGLRLLNWAVDEQKGERRILSEKNGHINIYPELLRK